MSKAKISKFQIIGIVLLNLMVLLNMFTILPGIVTISYNGFAVDQDGCLYLGKRNRIEVMDSKGALLRTIPAKPTLNYDFTILNNEIVLRVGSNLYWLDLSGNVLKEELRSERWKEIIPPNNDGIFVDTSGTRYTMEYSGFLRTSIFKWNGDEKIEIFKMPLFDYSMRLVLIFTVLGIVLMGGYTLGRLNTQGFFKGKLNPLWDLDSHRL